MAQRVLELVSMNLMPPLEPRTQPRGLRRALESDHAALELLLRDLVSAVEAGAHLEEAQAWSAFDARLRSHFALEEEYILPVFAVVDPDESSALLQEHHVLRTELRELGVNLTSRRACNAQVGAFLGRLDDHARREGSRVYRFTERRLGGTNARRTIATRLGDTLMHGGASAAQPRGDGRARRERSAPPVNADARVTDLMTCKVMVLSEEDNLSRVAEGLDLFRFRHIPVVDDGRLVGMVNHCDILRATVTGLDRSAPARLREARFLEQTFVRDVMRTSPLTALPEELVSVAAARMLDGGVDALAVLGEAGELVGILTQTDILDYAVRHGLLTRDCSEARTRP